MRTSEAVHNLLESMPDEPEPRWPALVAAIATVGLYTALPESLAVGPRWFQAVIVGGLLIPTVAAHRMGNHHVNALFGRMVNAVITIFMVLSLILLVHALPTHRESPIDLLRSAAALWVTNVLVFASWYWRLDAGGPHCRDRRIGHPTGAFLFPQMTLDTATKDEDESDFWEPKFIDYLFLAFNTSTALSPTDAPVLSRWAKVLVMLQASISLTILVVLAARAVNIL